RSIGGAIDAQRPDHFIYRGLMGALANLRKIEAQGGWPSVRAGKNLKPGVVDPRIVDVRRRLMASGELGGGMPRDSARYDTALQNAVEAFQALHRIDAKGVIGAPTVAAMNISCAERIAQVRVNLERARWVLGGLEGD